MEKAVLSRNECHELINLAEMFKFDTKPDGVDDEPEYQIDIFDGEIKNDTLWKICKKLYDTKMPQIDKTLDYVFKTVYTS